MRADYIGVQMDEAGKPSLCLFNIDQPGHPKHHSTVDLDEAMKLGAVETERVRSLESWKHERQDRRFHHG